MRRSTSRTGLIKLRRVRKWKPLILAVAAMPVLQATGCFPDPLGALNYELQYFFNTTLINAANTIIENILRL
ncbi:MAG: hypothetical protein ABII12_11555 [Planctomycetota bacterium]